MGLVLDPQTMVRIQSKLRSRPASRGQETGRFPDAGKQGGSPTQTKIPPRAGTQPLAVFTCLKLKLGSGEGD